MSIWKSETVLEKKPWGSVEIITSPFLSSGKIIRLNADQRTSLKFYTHLNQVLYCLSGKIAVNAPDEKEFGDYTNHDGNYFELLPGNLINIQSNNPYRLIAYENSVLVEILVGNAPTDYVMIDDDYGRNKIKTIIGDKND
jgi:mannose-6-phosphate isomerase-like protein (cupin superfamily)